ncbi:MAG: hypothetical protein RMJ54_19390, partial [Roseiflexaceae bacterium]|nr:hypothetical protein [Roseiflexaceae bacterium]
WTCSPLPGGCCRHEVISREQVTGQATVRSYTFDAEGNYVYGAPYPRESLSGQGSIDGHPVQCIAPEWLVRFHTGYPLDENDYHLYRIAV